jgi:glycosyltransferase involved in cell wall biosynthesis
LHLNADALPLAYAYLPDVFTGSYNVGFFYWELDRPAVPFQLALRMLDEVWVASEFGVSVFQPFCEIPVTNVGTPFEAVPDIPREEARAFLDERLGITDQTFVFLTTFDAYSWPTRKNPLGVLAAFQQAFGSGDDIKLVFKTHNARYVGHDSQRSELERLYAAAERDPRVVIVDETMEYGDLLRLKKGSDAYVSLHRSEGFGYGPIEAMSLGVPVICTAYSGNMDYCSEETAWLVSYELVDVEDWEYVFVRPGHRWAQPSVTDAAAQMRRCYEEDALRQRIADAAREFVTARFSIDAIARRYEARLLEILGP